MEHLSGSVGLAGRNLSADVRHVQSLLDAHGARPGPIDGKFGRLTLAGIVRFQRGFLSEPDGRVDVHGATWRHLLGLRRPAAVAGAQHAQTHPAARPAATVPRVAAPPARPAGATGHDRPAIPPPATVPPPPPVAPSVTSEDVRYTDHLPLPPVNSVNQGLRSPPNSLLETKFGRPRHDFGTDCRPPTNRTLAAATVTESVGPFRVTGLRPAVASLRQIFAEVQRDHPQLHAQLGTAGMNCCRLVRGSNHSISNHSWGTAIDMKVNGALVPWRSNYVIVGLAILAPYFNRHGWYWGAGYHHSKDPHHFECGSTLIESFQL